MNAAELATLCRKATRTAGGSWLACCPAHEDKSPSLTITDGRDGRTLVKCFAGCPADAVCAAVGLTLADLMPEGERRHTGPHRTPPTAPAPKATEPRKPITYPADIHPGAAGELQRLATLRNLSVEGLQIATDRDLLWFATVDHAAGWIITDGTRRNGQSRKLDGSLMWTANGGAKARTLAGSAAGWPIGSDRVADFQNVAICEGGPDLLAAFDLMFCEMAELTWTAVCMTGSSLKIDSDALPLFRGKRCRIFAHLDTAGRQAAERWERQLTEAGAQTEVLNLAVIGIDGAAIGDLNDVTSLTPEAWGDNPALCALFDEGGN